MLSSNIENPDFNTISKLFSDEFEKIKKIYIVIIRKILMKKLSKIIK